MSMQNEYRADFLRIFSSSSLRCHVVEVMGRRFVTIFWLSCGSLRLKSAKARSWKSGTYMYMYVYVCVCACMCVYIHVNTYVRILICTYSCDYAQIGD